MKNLCYSSSRKYFQYHTNERAGRPGLLRGPRTRRMLVFNPPPNVSICALVLFRKRTTT